MQGCCTQKDLDDYFYDLEPALQQSAEAIKTVTKTDRLELAWKRLRARRGIDLTPFREITNLRPLSNLIQLRTLTLPPGATILTLMPLIASNESTKECTLQSRLYRDEFEIAPDDSVLAQSCFGGGGMV